MISPYSWPGIARPLTIAYRITEEDVIHAVCNFYRVDEMKLHSTSRYRPLVRARHVIWMLCRRFVKGITLKHMGRMMGKDHTTVIHGLRAIEDDYDTDNVLASEIEQIAKHLKALR